MTQVNRTLSKRNRNRKRPSEAKVPADPSRWSEAQFQAKIKYEAHLAGWYVFEIYDMTMNEPGWPDLYMMHMDGRKFIAELKLAGKYPTQAQKKVHEYFRACGDRVYIWRPEDWEDIMKTMKLVGHGGDFYHPVTGEIVEVIG